MKFVPLTKDNILRRLSQEEIMTRYLGVTVSSTPITNPLRPNDKKPGCTFWTSSSGRLWFKDWAKDKIYDCFNIVMEKYNLSFYQSLAKINKDFQLGLGDTKSKVSSSSIKETPIKITRRKSIQAIPCKWTKEALSYWSSYGITKNILNQYFVYNTKLVYIDQNISQRATLKNPIFTYLYPPSTNIKIYRPLDKEKKWKSSTNKNDIDGIHQIPKKGKLLMITSSRKDIMVLRSLGFSAISPTTETVLLDEKVISSLKKRFKYIVTFMDSDKAGDASRQKYFDKFNIQGIQIPYRYNTKDISDFRAKFKKKKSYKLMKTLIKNNFNHRKMPY